MVCVGTIYNERIEYLIQTLLTGLALIGIGTEGSLEDASKTRKIHLYHYYPIDRLIDIPISSATRAY